MNMIERDLKCIRCGKRLLRGYSIHIKHIRCSCGCQMTLVHNIEKGEDFLIEDIKGRQKK